MDTSLGKDMPRWQGMPEVEAAQAWSIVDSGEHETPGNVPYSFVFPMTDDLATAAPGTPKAWLLQVCLTIPSCTMSQTST
jgi:hypothetical protein